MLANADMSGIIIGAIGLVAGAAAGYFLRRRHINKSATAPSSHFAPEPTESRPASFQEVLERLQDFRNTLGPDPTRQAELSEIIGLVQDQAAGIEQMIRDARTDSLTGLWNRRALDEQLPLQLSLSQRYKTPLCVVMVDIDHFKQLNDTHGHAAGDAALRQTARLLREGLRDSDFVARYGGEEFVLLLPQTDLAGALIAAERIRQRISQSSFQQSRQEISMNVSVGISQARHTDRGSDVLARADAALLHAKRSGRNQIQVES